jgi:hypothetical protein
MSELGQKATYAGARTKSALPPGTDVTKAKPMSVSCQRRKSPLHSIASSARASSAAGSFLLLSRVLAADWYCELKNGAIRVRFDEPQFASVVCD